MTMAAILRTSYSRGITPPFFHSIKPINRRARAFCLRPAVFDTGKAKDLRRRKT